MVCRRCTGWLVGLQMLQRVPGFPPVDRSPFRKGHDPAAAACSASLHKVLEGGRKRRRRDETPPSMQSDYRPRPANHLPGERSGFPQLPGLPGGGGHHRKRATPGASVELTGAEKVRRRFDKLVRDAASLMRDIGERVPPVTGSTRRPTPEAGRRSPTPRRRARSATPTGSSSATAIFMEPRSVGSAATPSI